MLCLRACAAFQYSFHMIRVFLVERYPPTFGFPSNHFNPFAQLQASSSALAALKKQMQDLASTLPEYPVVMQMYGVGPSLGPQLMAEIGDVRRFHSKSALVAFAGIDAPPPYQSGQIDVRSRSISKRGSAKLRRTLFLVMSVILQTSPLDEPIYQYMDKKRAEGKPYKVYMMASANKFLRRYYASVKSHLDELD